jgi:nucleoid-associated protein YgaU
MITRETKIGLLVGLAFVLVVGILLSEHVTAVKDKPTAALQASGDAVRRAVEAPMAAPPVSPDVVVENDPQPSTVVATRDQLDKPARAEVDVLDTTTSDTTVITVKRDPDALPPTKSLEPENVQLAGGLVDAARMLGEELVPLTASYDRKPTDPQPAPAPPARQPTSSVPATDYVAQPGDTLNKLAGRFLGGNTPANRRAIIDLNPQLQKQPDKIIVGQKYLIPVRDLAVKAPTTRPSAVPIAPAAPARKSREYVVQAGDSLWKIAKNELGDAGKIDELKSLNADLLGDSETVKVGMKLKLPD